MIAPKIFVATLAVAMTSGAMAGPTLGTTLGEVLGGTNLPILEGGILTVAVAALVAGVRIVQRKKERNG